MNVAFCLPELGEGVYEAELVQWKIQPGGVVEHGDTLAEVVTDKATMDVPSPFRGTVIAIHADEGSTVKVGDVVLDYKPTAVNPSNSSEPESAPTPSASVAPVATPRSSDTPQQQTGVRAAPSVRRLARSLDVDLSTVSGTGSGGRVLLDDLAAYVQRSKPEAAPATKKPALDLGQPGSTMPLRGLRRKVAEKMTVSSNEIPHYSYIDECNVSQLVRMKKELARPLAQQGIRLTYLTFWVRAVAVALREVPIVNATYDSSSATVTLHDRYDIGIATATENGLVVPVLRAVESMSFSETARGLESLITEVRERRATPDQLRGSTFTVTSIGNLGGLVSTPIINHPEVGIMGVGRIKRRPAYDDRDQIRPADLVYLSFSFDHRIVDGAIAALFSNAVIGALENPATLML